MSEYTVTVDDSSDSLQITVQETIENTVEVTLEDTLQVTVVEVGTQGPPGPAGTIPSELELHLAWAVSNPSYFKEFVYDTGVLTDINIYSDSGKTLQIFGKHFAYTLGVLTQIVTTRISDSTTETKNFNYTLGVLTSIDIISA